MEKVESGKLGWLFIFLGLASIVALPFANVDLVTMQSVYFADTGETKRSMSFHWPVILLVLLLMFGLVLILISRNRSQERPVTG